MTHKATEGAHHSVGTPPSADADHAPTSDRCPVCGLWPCPPPPKAEGTPDHGTADDRDEVHRRMQDEVAAKGLDPYLLCDGCHQPINTTGCTCLTRSVNDGCRTRIQPCATPDPAANARYGATS